jgi:SAM-dependent methyltransferase
VDIVQLQAELAHFLADTALTDDRQLARRAQALDFLAFLLDLLRGERHHTPLHQTLQQQAAQLQTQLNSRNQQLFRQLRSAVQRGTLTGHTLRYCLNQFTDYQQSDNEQIYMSYDGLDVLVDGLFCLSEAPAPTLTLATETVPTERVHCEETPARLLLELVDQIKFEPTDRFYDLGSGLGQVVMLVHLLTGVKAKGVEVEPAYCDFARQQAQDLGLTEVEFINADARTLDYSDGTHFFMFTPFRGQVLQSVLTRLYHQAQSRSIYLCTFGSCTPHVAEQKWLRPVTADASHAYKLVIFESLPFEFLYHQP